MKYANIAMERRTQNEGNLGDYIQIAAIDYIYSIMGIKKEEIKYIEYWDLMTYDEEDVILPLSFYYYNPSDDGRPFILSKKIHPIFLGIHLSGRLLVEEADYFKKCFPIGCRDESTLDLLKASAYFNESDKSNFYLQGCITAALPKRDNGDYDKIYLVDIPKWVEDKIPQEITKNCVRKSHLLYDKLREVSSEANCNSIMDFVNMTFKTYRDTAKLVITSRMHCAIPCVAMGIPVVFLVPAMSSRFTWIEKLIPIYTYDDIESINWNPDIIDYEDEKKNIIQLAINRISGDSETELIAIVSNWYLDRKKKSLLSNKGVDSLKEYALKHWGAEDNINYIIWGVTATSEEVYNWITTRYPNSKLVAVIDEYRDLQFHGLSTQRSASIIEHPNCYYIGTGASASVAMQKKLKSLGEDWLKRGIPIIP